MDSDELLARQLQEEEERLMKRTMMAAQSAGQQQQQQQQNQFLSRLQSGMETITKYEDEWSTSDGFIGRPCRGVGKKVTEGKEPKCAGLSFRDGSSSSFPKMVQTRVL